MLVLSNENTLHARQVSILRADRNQVFVRGGLQAGDRVSISVVEEFVEGMPVSVPDEEGPRAATSGKSTDNTSTPSTPSSPDKGGR